LRLKSLIPANLNLVLAGALIIAGLSIIAFSLAPAGPDTALAGRDGRDCDRNETRFDGNNGKDGEKDKCKDHDKTKTPTATPETPTSTPETPTATVETPTTTPEDPTATPEDPTATPEDPTATPEDPTATPEDPTATPTEITDTSGVAPTATPELIVDVLDAAPEIEEDAVLSAAPTEEVAALPASGSGGAASETGFKLGLGIGVILLGALIGLYGMRLDSRKQ
jgi:hypothetical protein